MVVGVGNFAKKTAAVYKKKQQENKMVATPDADIKKLIRVTEAAFRCHRDGSSKKLLLDAKAGKVDVIKTLGLHTAAEAEAALARVEADLKLLNFEDDPDLRETTEGISAPLVGSLAFALPFVLSDSLRLLAWNAAWAAVVARASTGEKPLRVDSVVAGNRSVVFGAHCLPYGGTSLTQEQLGNPELPHQDACTAWCAASQSAGVLSRPLADAITVAAEALSRHCAARHVLPKSKTEAVREWRRFCDAERKLKDAKVLHDNLRESMKWLLWNTAWHVTLSARQHQDDDDDDEEEEEDEDEEDDEHVYGEGYPGIDWDASKCLANAIQHSVECFRSDEDVNPRWRGLILSPEYATEDNVGRAAKAGFNVIRLALPMPAGDTSDVLAEARAMMSWAQAVDMKICLDLSAWSLRSRRFKIVDALRNVGAAALTESGVSLVCCVVLPRVPSQQSVAPLVEALREGGLKAEFCAVALPLEDAPLDDDGEYSGSLLRMLQEGAKSVLMRDGHVILESSHRQERGGSMPNPWQILDAASHSGEETDEHLPVSCARWDLSLPWPNMKVMRDTTWREELAARYDAGCGGTSHGWFASVQDQVGSLEACLSRRWSWPDPKGDRTLWPHGSAHRVSFIYMHGFQSDGDCYLWMPEYFQYEVDEEENEEEDEDEDEEDEDEKGGKGMKPYEGLKVILPNAIIRPITAYNGEKNQGWYDYLTDHEGTAEDDLDLASLEESCKRIHGMLDTEVQRLGDSTRVFLGGASQGCCAALHALLTYPKPLGGFCGTQGHLLKNTQVPADWASRGTPVRIYVGEADTTMPWHDWVSDTFDPLRKSGCDLKFELTPDVDHGDDDAEGVWVRSFLAEMWERQPWC